MRIEQADRSQAAEIASVARQSWHATYDEILSKAGVDAMVDEWYEIDALRSSIERDRHPMFVAVDDASVIGFAQGGLTDDGPADAVVSRIYLHPDRWGKGIGTELLDELCETFIEDGADDVWVVVLAENEVARRFYDRRGFSEVDRRQSELGGVTVAEVLMTKPL